MYKLLFYLNYLFFWPYHSVNSIYLNVNNAIAIIVNELCYFVLFIISNFTQNLIHTNAKFIAERTAAFITLPHY